MRRPASRAEVGQLRHRRFLQQVFRAARMNAESRAREDMCRIGRSLFDPSSGSRRAIVDSAKPLTALNAALPSGETLPKLPWPALDDSGRRGLYVLHGDIFLLDLESGDLTRLTSTAAQEGSATFSPDGRKIAFVRDHDLYVVDLRIQSVVR